MCTSCRRAIDSFYTTYRRLRTESRFRLFNDVTPGDNRAIRMANLENIPPPDAAGEPFLGTFGAPHSNNWKISDPVQFLPYLTFQINVAYFWACNKLASYSKLLYSPRTMGRRNIMELI